MKSLICVVFLCLLTTVLCHFSSTTTTHSSHIMTLTARRAMTASNTFMSNPEAEHWKIKNENKEATVTTIQREGSSPRSSESSDSEDDQMIYHIDYHGVSTHPNPTPKHPVP